MPPAPPCTRNVSPGCSPATMNTLDHTVHATSGSAAAVHEVDAGGHRHHLSGRHRDAGRRSRHPASSAQTSVADRPARRRRRRPPRRCRCTPARGSSEAPGRRRVVTLPLQQVGPVDRGRGDVEQRPRPDRARGRDVGGRPAPRGRPARGGTARLHSSNSSPLWSTPRVVRDVVVDVDGVRRARRAVPALGQRLGPRGQPLDLLGVGVRGAGGVPEQVRRDRGGRPDDVVGGHLGEVEDQCLVDLGLDVEDVTQLVDPVVQVHGPNLANRRPSVQVRRPSLTSGRFAVGAGARRPRCRCPRPRPSSAGTSRTCSRSISRLHRQRRARPRAGGTSERPYGAGQLATAVRRRSARRRPRPRPPPAQPGEGGGGDVRHVDRQHDDPVVARG